MGANPILVGQRVHEFLEMCHGVRPNETQLSHRSGSGAVQHFGIH